MDLGVPWFRAAPSTIRSDLTPASGLYTEHIDTIPTGGRVKAEQFVIVKNNAYLCGCFATASKYQRKSRENVILYQKNMHTNVKCTEKWSVPDPKIYDLTFVNKII